MAIGIIMNREIVTYDQSGISMLVKTATRVNAKRSYCPLCLSCLVGAENSCGDSLQERGGGKARQYNMYEVRVCILEFLEHR